MLKMLDPYSLKARFFPALLAFIPSLAALGIVISWAKLSLTGGIAATAMPVLVFAGADIARRLGRRVEQQFYQEGGKPSVAILRHSDSTLDAGTKARYLAFLGEKVGQVPPTEQQEQAEPAEADAFYERCGGWLRENTRDMKKFSILFNENVTYGYRRNLFGLKWPAVILNIALIGVCAYVLSGKLGIDLAGDLRNALLIILVFSIVHALFMTFAVTKQSVIDASKMYARQLLLCCELLIGKGKPARAPSKKGAS